jgi:hypothetical protein
MFRIIEQEQKNPELMLKSMLDYVNSFASTSLDVAGLKLTIDTLSPLSNFEFQKNYFDNQNSALYYRTAFDAAVKFNVDKGVLPSGKYDADDVIWASGVYHDLVALSRRRTTCSSEPRVRIFPRKTKLCSRKQSSSTLGMIISTRTGCCAWRCNDFSCDPAFVGPAAAGLTNGRGRSSRDPRRDTAELHRHPVYRRRPGPFHWGLVVRGKPASQEPARYTA